MNTRPLTFASAAVVAFACVTGAIPAVANASPVDDSAASAGCQLILTPPELVMLPGGAKAVRATLNPKTCDPSAQPTGVTVCVRPADSQGDCKRLPGWAKAEVIIAASPAHGTFTATGEICWQEITKSFRPACRTAGPLSSTL
jgi:hypothetical protein